MGTLATLIKLNRFRLDEQRRIVAEIESRRAALAQDGTALETELVAEREEAGRDPDSLAMFPAFISRWMDRKRLLGVRMIEVEEELGQARDRLAAAFRELKQYELAADARAEAARIEDAKRQQAALDEISLTIFRQQGGGQPGS